MDKNESRWADIFRHLKNKGFDVRPPGQTTGVCKGRYIVVKFNGENEHGNFSTNDTFYGLLCYVPQNNYSDIDCFVRDVQRAMKELEPMILPTNEISCSYFDDKLNAWYVSIGYKNYKRRI